MKKIILGFIFGAMVARSYYKEKTEKEVDRAVKEFSDDLFDILYTKKGAWR